MDNRAGNRNATPGYSSLSALLRRSAGHDKGPASDPTAFLMSLTPNDSSVSIPDNALFVWDSASDLEVGVIVELSMEGLVFEYFDLGWVMTDTGSFDLLTDAGMCISAIPYQLLSDERVIEEAPTPVPIRRARVRFGTLLPAKRTALETLMSIYGGRTNRDQPPPDRHSASDPPLPDG